MGRETKMEQGVTIKYSQQDNGFHVQIDDGPIYVFQTFRMAMSFIEKRCGETNPASNPARSAATRPLSKG